MDPDISYEKLKILCVNIFFVMFKAATLNLHKLDQNLREVNTRLQLSDHILMAYVLRFFISLLLLTNFIVGYCAMAANVISTFPILTDEQPELLLPTLVVQLVENVGLTITEFVLGYFLVKYCFGECSKLLMPFAARLIAKTVIGLSVLNMYADFYLKMASKHVTMNQDFGSEEKFIKKQSLS